MRESNNNSFVISSLGIFSIFFVMLLLTQVGMVSAADVTPPVISGVPSNQVTEATSPAGAMLIYPLPTAIDAVDGPVPVNCSRAPGSTFALGNTTVTCTAIDSSSNLASASFIVSVIDDIAPSISGLPTNASTITLNATSSSGATYSYSLSATDIVDGSVSVICSIPSGSTFPIGNNFVTCTATDAHSNVATRTFTISVVDTTPPIITGTPSNFNVEATSFSNTLVTYPTPTAVDIVDGSRTVVCSPLSNTPFVLGNTTVTCSASDTRGNTASTSFVVNVRDTTAPTITTPSSITLNATSSNGAVFNYNASAVDLVDGSVVVNCSKASGTNFSIASTVVTCNSVDSHNNLATKSFTVTVQDITPPVISGMPANSTVEATGLSGAVSTYVMPTAVDLVDGPRTVICSKLSGSTFALGNTTVTCSASDTRGNTATKTFMVSVVDTTPPVVSGTPSNIVQEAVSPLGNIITYVAPTAFDIVDPSVTINCTNVSGSLFNLGSIAVVCIAKDFSGNVGWSSFVVTIRDTTAPVITGILTDINNVQATSPSGAVVNYSLPSVTDIVDTAVVSNCSPASNSIFSLGSTLVTCNARDFSNNTALPRYFSVTVVDTTAPVISGLPINTTREATSLNSTIVNYTAPIATDIVSGVLNTTCIKPSGSAFNLGNTTVTCSAIDSSGNLASQSFVISVVDTTAPNITGLPVNNTREATSPAGAIFTYTLPTAVDLVDGSVVVNCSKLSGSTFALGNTTVNCTSKDSHNNLASRTFVVTVVDTTAPVISGLPVNNTREATSPAGAIFNYTLPTALDLVDGNVSVNCSYGSSPSELPVDLGTAGNFVILAKSGISTTGTTSIVGDIGVSPIAATAITGFGLIMDASNTFSTSSLVTGKVYAANYIGPPATTPVKMTTAVSDMQTAYTDAAGRAPDVTELGAGNIGGMTLVPGVYKWSTNLLIPTDITLSGNSNDVWIFQVAQNLNIASGKHIILSGGAQAKNIFWVVAGQTTLGTTSVFNGNILDQTAIVLNTGATLNGRALAQTAVTLDANNVSIVAGQLLSGLFALGNTTVNCTSKDSHNNLASRTFVVTVVDTTAPVISGLPVNNTIEATSPAGAKFAYTLPTAYDIVSGNITVGCSMASNTTFPFGNTTVTCSATDSSSNFAFGSFVVTVRDTIAPNITGMPANISKGSTSAAGAVVNYVMPTAVDNINGNVSVNCSKASGATFAVGTNIVTCSATDNSSNIATKTFTVIITPNPYFTTGSFVVYTNVSMNYSIGVNDSGGAKIVSVIVNNSRFQIIKTNSTFIFTNNNTVIPGTYALTLTAFNNNSMNNSESILLTILTPNQQYVTAPIETIQSNKTEIVINQGSNNLNTVILPSTIPGSISVDLIALLNGKNVTILNDLSLITVQTYNYSVNLPANTIIYGASTWNGKLLFPVVAIGGVASGGTYTISGGTVDLVIQVSNDDLNFSSPVKVILGGMAGKNAAYAQTGIYTLTDIPTVCNSAVNPTNIDATTTKECYINSGSDLLIWTYHFSAFGAYDIIVPPPVVPVVSHGGGGGSGGYYVCGNWSKCTSAGNQVRICNSGTGSHSETSACNYTSDIVVIANLTEPQPPVNNTIEQNTTSETPDSGNIPAKYYSIKSVTGGIVNDLREVVLSTPERIAVLVLVIFIILLVGWWIFNSNKTKKVKKK